MQKMVPLIPVKRITKPLFQLLTTEMMIVNWCCTSNNKKIIVGGSHITMCISDMS